jgi:hypothetical protein
MKKHAAIGALLCLSALAACGPDALQNITAPPFTSSRIRFFNFGVNAPGANFYADTAKMTAIQVTIGKDSSAGTTYAAVAPSNGDYVAINSGAHTLIAKLAADTTHPTISSLATTIGDGKYYSFYLSGIYNSTAKTVESFVVEDPFTIPADTSTANVRFVNAISNSSPMILYAKNQTTGVEVPIGGATAIAYKSASSYTSLGTGLYDLSTRLAGSSTNILTRTSVTFAGHRVYTISARGDITVASTSTTTCASTNKTCLDNTANY